MKALIFAAGMGNRLRPITNTMPKALVPVGGKPMLEHVILKLKAAGFDSITINIHHFGEQIIDFLKEHQYFGVDISISDERDYLLETGGGIKKAEPFLKGDGPFLVHNVDIFSNVDLRQLYDSHCANPKTLATLLVSKRKTSRYLLFDDDNRLCGWRNRETNEIKSYYPYFDPARYSEYAFGGIHVISPEIFRWMEEWTGRFSIVDFYLSICAKAKIVAYPLENLQLMDVGKPETLRLANEWLSNHKE